MLSEQSERNPQRETPDKKLIRLIRDEDVENYLRDGGNIKLIEEMPSLMKKDRIHKVYEDNKRVVYDGKTEEEFKRECKLWKQKVKRFLEKHYNCKIVLEPSYGNCFNARMYKK